MSLDSLMELELDSNNWLLKRSKSSGTDKLPPQFFSNWMKNHWSRHFPPYWVTRGTRSANHWLYLFLEGHATTVIMGSWDYSTPDGFIFDRALPSATDSREERPRTAGQNSSRSRKHTTQTPLSDYRGFFPTWEAPLIRLTKQRCSVPSVWRVC